MILGLHWKLMIVGSSDNRSHSSGELRSAVQKLLARLEARCFASVSRYIVFGRWTHPASRCRSRSQRSTRHESRPCVFPPLLPFARRRKTLLKRFLGRRAFQATHVAPVEFAHCSKASANEVRLFDSPFARRCA
jgi:hypothetical protein